MDTRSLIVLLIHPKEVQRSLGTAPLLQLCLRNMILKVGEKFPEPDEDPEFHEQLHAGGRRCFLVCPGPGAEELRPPALQPTAPTTPGCMEACWSMLRRRPGAAGASSGSTDPPRTLIFIDGRWKQAKTMVNRSIWLREQTPRVVLCPAEQSGYMFRKQPAEGCLSTLEAVAEALLALEGQRGPTLKAALLAPFRRMVEVQCGFIPEVLDKNERLAEVGQRRQKKRADAAEEEEADEAASRTLRPYSVEVAYQVAEPASADPRSQEHGVFCILRWGERGVVGREVVVVKIARMCPEAAKRLAAQMSCGKTRGHRFWVLPPEKVPAGALYEVSAA